MALTGTRQDTFAIGPEGSFGPRGRAGKSHNETWQMNCTIDASLKHDIKIAAFEAGVSQSAYIEKAVVGQLIADGWLTAAEARRRGLTVPAERAV